MAMKNITCKVPKNNKEVFIDPPISSIPDLVQENRRKIRGYRFEINTVPFQVLRDKIRNELLHRAVKYTGKIKSLFRNDGSELPLHTQNTVLQDVSWQINHGRILRKGSVLDYDSIKNMPIIQTGHEPVLYHPGIWIKNHLIQHLSEKLNGIGINMIVDNDACNMGFMYVPVFFTEPAAIQKVSFIKSKEKVAYEEIKFDDLRILLRFKEEVMALLRENIDKGLMTHLFQAVTKISSDSFCYTTREYEKTKRGNCCSSFWRKFGEKNIPGTRGKMTFENMLVSFERFMGSITERHRRGCVDMVELLTTARSALEEEFSLDNLEVPVSWMCDTEGFYHFLMHILCEADRFAAIYNEKLAEYRTLHKIRSNANPLPDLKITGNLVELPFWVWKAGGQRDKCYLLSDDEFIKVKDGSDILITLRKDDSTLKSISRLKTLMENQIKIRPRAITTTMFSRLFFSDIFIHGIGGARYDTITDEIIREFFHVDPPDFVTISATLFLPFNTFDLNHSTLQIMQHGLRDMHYNPERYASLEIQNDAEFVCKLKEKQRLLDAMSASNKEKRRWCFHQIKELNKSMLNQIHTKFLEKQREIDTIARALAYNEVARFREYPIGIYPMEILKEYFLNVFS